MSKKVADRPKTRPAANGKPLPVVRTKLEEIESGDRADPRENAIPDASREMFDAMMEKIRWHHDEVASSLRVIDRGDPTAVVDALAELGRDARDMWALADLLRQAAGTGR